MNIPSKVDVLIVDDREEGLMALEAVLNMANINLVRADSGTRALTLLPYYNFAVILLDVQMPGIDGFDTALEIRKRPEYRSTPIIFVTAINSDDQYMNRGYEVGAVDYIFKPFEPHVLRSKVSFFIELFVKNEQLREQAEVIRKNERRERYLKLAEQEVKSLQRYSNLADSIPHIVWKARADGVFDYFNKVWFDYSGLDHPHDLYVEWQAALQSEDLKIFLKVWDEAVQLSKPVQTECRIRRADGEWRWHWVRATPEFHNGEVVAWLGTCTDIQDRKLNELRVIEAEKVARAANVAKTNFLANMSHEIRTPMCAILGFTELMMNSEQPVEERMQFISIVHRSGRQLLRVIDEILDISKVEAGRLEVEILEVNVPELIADINALMSGQARERNLDFAIHLKSEIPQWVFTDPTRFRQILINIIGNAIKFTEKGSVNVDVEWIGQKPSGELHIRVRDTGIGVDPEQISRLFKPFTQVDTSTTRRFGGAGLGLALSRRLALALDGDLTLESGAEGKGSTFLIKIKGNIVRGSTIINVLDMVTPVKLVEPSENRNALKNVNILLVEDAPDNQKLISRILTLAGASVDIAGDGVEGVSKALSGNHQVVLMDIQMPHMDGYEAVTQLRSQGYSQPIIALTARALREERERCISIGCTDCMTKPVNRQELINRVAQAAHAAAHSTVDAYH